MPSLIDIRRRIRSVKNTQQITKAMKMVAAAKLRRAQDRVIAARPYNTSLRRLLANIAAAVRSSQAGPDLHPLLTARPEKRIVLIVITSDRGLAGAFSMNVIKAAQQFLQAHPDAEIRIEALGRKGRDFFRRRGAVTGEHVVAIDKAGQADASRISDPIVSAYAAGDIDAVYAIGNEFRSVISQRVTVEQLLPLVIDETQPTREYLLEGDPGRLLDALLPLYVENVVLRMMLESGAAEHAARMTAMDAATNNAKEVIEKLTLNMNRVRQASITKEIIEVVSGAQAL